VPSGVRTGMSSTWGMPPWWSADLKMRSSLRIVGICAPHFEGTLAQVFRLADLDRTYSPRLAGFVSEERFGAWRCKLYGLADPAKGVRPELLDATRERASANLPGDGYGASFAIAHDAAYPIALVYWWQGVNELHQRSFIGASIEGLEPVEWTPAGCVYELAIVEFERRAWIDDVIGNPDGPDLERYLGRRFGGLV
jgi:hypothetical protein